MAFATAIPSRHHPLNPLYKELRRVHWYHCTTTSLTSLSSLSIQYFNVLSIRDADIITRLQCYSGVLLGPTYCYQDCISMLMQVSQCILHSFLCGLHCPVHVPHVLQVVDHFTLLNFLQKCWKEYLKNSCIYIFLLLQA